MELFRQITLMAHGEVNKKQQFYSKLIKIRQIIQTYIIFSFDFSTANKSTITVNPRFYLHNLSIMLLALGPWNGISK